MELGAPTIPLVIVKPFEVVSNMTTGGGLYARIVMELVDVELADSVHAAPAPETIVDPTVIPDPETIIPIVSAGVPLDTVSAVPETDPVNDAVAATAIMDSELTVCVGATTQVELEPDEMVVPSVTPWPKTI